MVTLTANVTAEEIRAVAAMTNEQRANLAAQINSTHPATIFDLVENKTDEIICPFCGSGTHGNKNTGIKPTEENGVWLYKCFAGNDCDGDLIKIIADANHLSTRGKDFFEVLAIAAKITNQNFFVPSDGTRTKTRKEATNTATTDKVESFARLDESRNNLPAFLKTHNQWRGLSADLLQKLNWGFLPDIYFPDAKKKLPAIIIPNDKGGIFARAVDGKFYRNNKPTFTTTVFLPDTNEFNLIVTEGAINGASILQAFQDFSNELPKFGIISSGGTSGNKHVTEKLQQLTDEGKKIRVLIAYDNDDNGAGQTAADKLFKSLLRAGFNACTVDITQQADVDCNNILQQDGGNFTLFNLVENMFAQVETSRADDTPADATPDTDSAMVEVPADYVPEDEFEIAKDNVLADQLRDPEISKFFVPLPYVITNHGIRKIGKKDIAKICPRPILIKDKFFNLNDGTTKLTLEFLSANKKWIAIPPQKNSVILHKNRIVDLADFDLPVSTSNASKLVDYLHALYLANEPYIPLTYSVNRCGWFSFNDKDFFIDPRIDNKIKDDNGREINLIVDNSNTLALSLKTAGTLEEWKKAYNLAADSAVARLNVAAAVAPVLLKVLGERNFVVYTHGRTRGGKSTGLFLAASAVGKADLVRVFDGTNNGLIAAAADTNHLPFFVDEWQGADAKLKADKQRWIYSDAGGVERTRANKDGTVRPARSWQHITLCNGETPLLNDDATGGAYTRILQVHSPDTILDADTCKKIRDIISKNYGHAFPLFVNHLLKQDFNELRKLYQDFQSAFESYCKGSGIEVIPEYFKYVALLFIADSLLNQALNNDIPSLEYGHIFNMLPTTKETDDATREFNIIQGTIVEKIAHFVASEIYNSDRGLDIFGRSNSSEVYTFITVKFLKEICAKYGLDYDKVVDDCIKAGYFIPDDKVRDSRMKKPSNTVQKKLAKDFKANVFQIPNNFIYGDDESNE